MAGKRMTRRDRRELQEMNENSKCLIDKKCVPCEGGVPVLTDGQEDGFTPLIPQWSLSREGVHRITRTWEFGDFVEAMAFVNKVAEVAEEEGHHPNISIYYNKVHIELYTHAIGGLSINDFIVASKIDCI
jgi:4a-hydroxytetrahydrobiopterin dehydratase